MSSKQAQTMNRRYTNEVSNVALANVAGINLKPLLEADTTGPFWETLASQNITLAVSREYEHFITLLGSEDGKPVVSGFEMPHPSGMFYDQVSGDLIVSSTRTPNQIFWMRPLQEEDYNRDIIPANFNRPQGTIFLPYRSLLLPGSLYIHDVVMIGKDLYATITGHNFLAKLDADGGWERVWWPELLDGMGRSAFDQNYLQLNSIAVGDSPSNSFYTAFSSETGGAKPWKKGYGPKGRGVVFDGASRQVLLTGLTCPHSAKLHQGELWLCNSGYGQVGKVVNLPGDASFEVVATLDGFARGLAFSGKYAFVGLSKVIDSYEPYAPGIPPAKSLCGIVILDTETGETAASLEWPQGYQIYDVQVMSGVRNALLPSKNFEDQGINSLLRYLG